MLKTGASLVVAAATDDSRRRRQQQQQQQESNDQRLDEGSSEPSYRRRGAVGSVSNGGGMRKRKRRPQLTASPHTHNSDQQQQQQRYWRGHVEDDNSVHMHALNASRRRKQPAAIREPLAALEKEQKLFELRDKQRQEVNVGIAGGGADKSYRRPYGQAKRDEIDVQQQQQQQPPTKNPVDLKHILKQTGGGLSLSEILQQKNLSLDDLLRGKENALLALQTTVGTPQGGGNISSSGSGGTQQPVRKMHAGNSPTAPAMLMPAASATAENDAEQAKGKLKFPTLHRLKLFGTPSRATPNAAGDVATTKRREYATTTTTTSTTTTTRLPIYKKHLMQRPTLKPPGLLKVPSIATTGNGGGVAVAAPTTTTTTTTTATNESPTMSETLAITATATGAAAVAAVEIEQQQHEGLNFTMEEEEDEEGETEAEETVEAIAEDDNESDVEELEAVADERDNDVVEQQQADEPAAEDALHVSSSTTTTTTTTTTTAAPATIAVAKAKEQTNKFEQTTQANGGSGSSSSSRQRAAQRGRGTTARLTTKVPTTRDATTARDTTTTYRTTTYRTTPTTTRRSSEASNFNVSSKLKLANAAIDIGDADDDGDDDAVDGKQPLNAVNFIPHRDVDTKTNANKQTTTPIRRKSSNKVETDLADVELENYFDSTFEQNNSESVESQTLRIERKPTARSTSRTTTTTTRAPLPYMPLIDRDDDVVLPDFDGIDDRTDLLELIEDRRSGNRLFKVLEQRNMTLEELIEHRKRGSSQLHFSTIVQNQSRLFPEQKVVLHDDMDIVTAFENFPHFNLLNLKSVKPDDIKTDSQGSSYFTSIIDIEPTDEGGGVGYGSKSGGGGSLRDADNKVAFYPSWKTLALASLATKARNDVNQRHTFYLPQPKLLLESNSAEVSDDADAEDETEGDGGASVDIDLLLSNETATMAERQLPSEADVVEAIENEVARAHDLLDLELSGHGFKRSPAAAASSMAQQGVSGFYARMPAGIRSAIVASAAIVLASLTTFVVIFVFCRWKQRRRRRTNYTKSYNAMKSKLPTLATAAVTSATATSTTTTASSSSTSRRASLCNMEELVGGITTISQLTPVHQLSRQSSLLFPPAKAKPTATTTSSSTAATHKTKTTRLTTDCNYKSNSNHNNPTNSSMLGIGNSCTNSLLSGRGLDSMTGSTTSLALSLRSSSIQNIAATKLNTLDPNSPEVQEYLFDTLRKSF